jgi:hypothetical protein
MRAATPLPAAIAALLAAIFGALSAVQAAACEAARHLRYDEPVELEGVIGTGKGHHEAQGDFTYTYLALDEPLCVDAPAGGGDEDFGNTGTDKPVDRIQVVNPDDKFTLEPGARVRLKGKLFGAMTMWHAEEVLIGTEAVEPR